MILADTNDLIEIVSDATATTNELQWSSYYADHTTTTLTPAASNGLTNGTTPVTLVGSPAASTQRQVKFVSIFNNDTVVHLITVRFDDGTNERILCRILLQVGETLQWTQEYGWRVIDPYGIRKEGTVLSIPKAAVYQNVGFNAANITGTRTITSTNTMAQYLGKAEYAYTSCQLRYRITTAAATITWAEVAIASGTFNLGGNQTLTTRGFTDVSGSINSTGLKQTTVALTGVTAGMDLYALIGNQAVTAAVVRAGLGDDITTGFASAAVARPSTMAGGTTFTLAANSDSMIWWAATFS